MSAARTTGSVRLRVESLGQREVPALIAHLGGVLIIDQRFGGNPVRNECQVYWLTNGNIGVEDNGAVREFDRRSVTRIDYIGSNAADHFVNWTGLRCSAAGNAGNDTLQGGNGSDTINGGGGVDYLYGQGGNDVIDGDMGAATWTQHGGDCIYGQDGNDTLHGGFENDIIDGGNGHD